MSTSLWPRLSFQSRAQFRSEGGTMASVSFTSFPISHHCKFDSQPFRVLFLRRFWFLLLPLRVLAGVACHSTPVPTPCSVLCGMGSGTRGFCSGKCGCICLSPGRARVSVNVRVQTWTWPVHTRWTTVFWRWWLMGFPCIREHRWLWTPHSCQS